MIASLDRRGHKRGTIAERDLPRYYQLIDDTERTLPLTTEERVEIVEAMRAYPQPIPDPQQLWTAVFRSPHWTQPGKSSDYGQALGTNVSKLTLVQRMALADFAERILTLGLSGDPEFVLELNEAHAEASKKRLLELLRQQMGTTETGSGEVS